jgi:hypothetical protein
MPLATSGQLKVKVMHMSKSWLFKKTLRAPETCMWSLNIYDNMLWINFNCTLKVISRSRSGPMSRSWSLGPATAGNYANDNTSEASIQTCDRYHGPKVTFAVLNTLFFYNQCLNTRHPFVMTLELCLLRSPCQANTVQSAHVAAHIGPSNVLGHRAPMCWDVTWYPSCFIWPTFISKCRREKSWI